MLLLNKQIRRYFWPALIGLTLLYWLYHMIHRPIKQQQPSRPLASLFINSNADRKWPEGSIPKIIHQTWKSHHVPEVMAPWAQSWMKVNPDWEYWFWTNDDIRNLVEMRFPQHLKLFDSYPDDGYRADAFRLVLCRLYMFLFLNRAIHLVIAIIWLMPYCQ